MKRAVLAGVLFLVAGCALRPRYRDVLESIEGPVDSARVARGGFVEMRAVDPKTGKPLDRLKVVVGEGISKTMMISDAQGKLELPVTPRLYQENPLVEVFVPAGGNGYQFQNPKQPTAPSNELSY